MELNVSLTLFVSRITEVNAALKENHLRFIELLSKLGPQSELFIANQIQYQELIKQRQLQSKDFPDAIQMIRNKEYEVIIIINR